ncbi:ash family protein [Salmonella enterica]|nr:ash family protein [Salmonella enterica]
MSTMSSKALDRLNCWRYSYPAPYKTGAGICSPKLTKATPDAASVFFVVRYTRHSMAWCAHLMAGCPQAPDHATAHRAALIMVTLAGQPQGWPVPFVPGTANPVNVTAPIEICSSRGDSLTRTKEAAIMAKFAQSQVVFLPFVCPVDPESPQIIQWTHETENQLLDRVKAALDEAGVAWIDPRTKERSKPATTDSVEGSDNA